MTFTIRLTKLRLTAAVGLFVLAGAATAFAAHPFDDVEEGKWYSDAVDWAYANDITTGKTPTEFDGDAPVTRYEAVTFQHRYDENVVQPALDAIDAVALEGFAANELLRAAQVSDATGVDDWDGSDLDHDLVITAPVNGALLVTSTTTVGRDVSEAATGPGEVFGTLRLDGADVADFIGTSTPIDFDLTGFTTEDSSVVMHHLIPVGAGTHTVTSRVGASVPAGGLVKVYGRTLTALFVAFDGTGAPFAPG